MKKEYSWIITVFILSFVLSAIFSGISYSLSNINIVLLILLILIVIIIGIIFDMIGVAVLSAEESPFHAMNSKKIDVAKPALKLIKNSSKVSSVCNDVVGDVCGIISGSLGSLAILYISEKFNIPMLVSTITITSLISSLTVGGKAIFKRVAVKKSNEIILLVSKLIKYF